MKRFMKEHIIEIASILVVVLFSTFCFFLVLNKFKSDKTIDEPTSSEVESDLPSFVIEIDSNQAKNEVHYINFYDKEEIDDEYYILIIERDGCSACDRFKVNYKDFVTKYTIPVYVANTKDLTEEDKLVYHKTPSWEFYKDKEMFYSHYGNVDAELLYKNFIDNLKG